MCKAFIVKITEGLMLDHRAIEEMLAILDSMCQRMDAGNAVDAEHLHAAVQWLHEFIGGWHLDREEAILFPALAKSVLHPSDSTIEAMLHAHRRERHLLAEMARASSRVQRGKDGADEGFCDSAKACIKLITAHIQQEESEFYPAAEQLLDEREHHEFRHTCRRLEEEMDRQGFDRMMATLRRLKIAYPGSG